MSRTGGQQLTMTDLFTASSNAVVPPPPPQADETPTTKRPVGRPRKNSMDPLTPNNKPQPPPPVYYPIPPPPATKKKEKEKEKVNNDDSIEDFKAANKKATAIRQVIKFIELLPRDHQIQIPKNIHGLSEEKLAELKKILLQTILSGYEEKMVRSMYYGAVGNAEVLAEYALPFFPRNPIIRRIASLERGTISKALEDSDPVEINRDLEVISVLMYDLFPTNPFLKLIIDTGLAVSALSSKQIIDALRSRGGDIEMGQQQQEQPQQQRTSQEEFERIVMSQQQQ